MWLPHIMLQNCITCINPILYQSTADVMACFTEVISETQGSQGNSYHTDSIRALWQTYGLIISCKSVSNIILKNIGPNTTSRFTLNLNILLIIYLEARIPRLRRCRDKLKSKQRKNVAANSDKDAIIDCTDISGTAATPRPRLDLKIHSQTIMWIKSYKISCKNIKYNNVREFGMILTLVRFKVRPDVCHFRFRRFPATPNYNITVHVGITRGRLSRIWITTGGLG